MPSIAEIVIRRPAALALALTVAATALLGCGQTGPLYLPDKPPEPAPKAAAMPATTSTAATSTAVPSP